MDFSNINKVGRLENFLPTRRWSEITVNMEYKVTALVSVKTKYGAGVVASINDEYSLYLPARVVNYMQAHPEEYQAITKTATDGQLYLRYLGGKYHQCEFFVKN